MFLNSLQARLPETLRKHILDAVDEVHLSPGVITPLIEDKPSLRRIVVFIDPLDDEFDHILQFDVVYSLVLFLLIRDLNQLCLVFLKGLQLHLRLEYGIVDSHDLSLDLILSLLDISILDEVLEGHLETVELALLAVLHSLFQKSVLAGLKQRKVVPLFKTSGQVDFKEMSECIAHYPVSLLE